MARLEEESNQRSAISVDRDDAVLALQVYTSTLTLVSGLSEDHSRYHNSEKKVKIWKIKTEWSLKRPLNSVSNISPRQRGSQIEKY